MTVKRKSVFCMWGCYGDVNKPGYIVLGSYSWLFCTDRVHSSNNFRRLGECEICILFSSTRTLHIHVKYFFLGVTKKATYLVRTIPTMSRSVQKKLFHKNVHPWTINCLIKISTASEVAHVEGILLSTWFSL